MYEHKAEKKHIKFPHFCLQEMRGESRNMRRMKTLHIIDAVSYNWHKISYQSRVYSYDNQNDFFFKVVHAACKNGNNRFILSVHKILYILGLAWWR